MMSGENAIITSGISGVPMTHGTGGRPLVGGIGSYLLL